MKIREKKIVKVLNISLIFLYAKYRFYVLSVDFGVFYWQASWNSSSCIFALLFKWNPDKLFSHSCIILVFVGTLEVAVNLWHIKNCEKIES